MAKEMYWPFKCDNGHEFDFGPIHNPDDVDVDEATGEITTKPGSGRKKDVPEETRGCPVCAKEIPLVNAAQVMAYPVKSGKAVHKSG